MNNPYTCVYDTKRYIYIYIYIYIYVVNIHIYGSVRFRFADVVEAATKSFEELYSHDNFGQALAI